MRKKTGGMQKGFKYKLKKSWYTNGVIETQIFETDSIPEGFSKGRLKFNKPAWNSGLRKENCESLKKMSFTKKINKKKRFWINNGVVEKLISDHNEIPKGFYLGRLGSKKKLLTISTFIDYYNTHSLKDCYKEFNLSKQELYKLVQDNNLEPVAIHIKRLRKLTYTQDWRKKHGQTLKGKNTWSKGCKHSQDQIRKFKESHSKRSIIDIKKSKLKEYETRMKNGSYKKHMTKDEKEVKNILLKYFNESDIKYLYFDYDRYPFECDFYIKSKDLFIEVNIYPSHGGELFNKDNKEHIEKLNTWKYKKDVENKKQYGNWIYTWTDLDIRKNNFAKINNLNYISLYDIKCLEDSLNAYL